MKCPILKQNPWCALALSTLVGLLSVLATSSCCNHLVPISMSSPESKKSKATLHDTSYTAFDGSAFGYVRWLPHSTSRSSSKASIKRVIIATHGICGANEDFKGFAEFVQKQDAHTAIYAHNTRSQGYDPLKKRRGHIKDPTAWYDDLLRFSRLVSKKYPGAEIIWFGESMGAMISVNTFAAAMDAQSSSNAKPPCDRMILSAPVVNLKRHAKRWQNALIKVGSTVLPCVRIPLNLLAGGQSFEITDGLDHNEVAAENEYTIKGFTLRFLHIFSKDAEKMQTSLGKVTVPVSVFHGGKDFLTNKQDIEQFISHSSPQNPCELYHYPEAFHLILFDDIREKIFTDMLNWVHKSKGPR